MSLSRIEELLADNLPAMTRAGPRGPTRNTQRAFTFQSVPGVRGRCVVEGEWITLRIEAARTALGDGLDRLIEQSSLPFGIKMDSAAKPHRAIYYAALPALIGTAAERDWLKTEIADALDALRAIGAGKPLPISVRPSAAGLDELVERLRGLGVAASVNSTGEVRVKVQARALPRAIVVTSSDARLHARVTIATVDLGIVGAQLRAALGCFLSRANTAMRFARAAIHVDAGAAATLGFECRLAASTADGPIACALDALSTACEHFGNELEALIACPSLAQLYLEYTGGIALLSDPDADQRIETEARPAVSVPAPNASSVAFVV